jgi:hypothetical protein
MSGSNGENQEKKPALNIATSDEVILNPKYVNVMLVNVTPFEVTFDFAHHAPMLPAARHTVRLITSLEHFKRMVQVMSTELAKVEAAFGEIRIGAQQQEEVIFQDKGN